MKSFAGIQKSRCRLLKQDCILCVEQLNGGSREAAAEGPGSERLRAAALWLPRDTWIEELWSASGALGQPGLAERKDAIQGRSGGMDAIEEFVTSLSITRDWQRG